MGFFLKKAVEGELFRDRDGWFLLLLPPLDGALSSMSISPDMTFLVSEGEASSSLELCEDVVGETQIHCPPEVPTADVVGRLAPLTTLSTRGRALLDLLDLE